MTLIQAQQMAHELTMLYLQQHPNVLDDVLDNIPKTVDLVADINKRYFDALIHNKKFDGLY